MAPLTDDADTADAPDPLETPDNSTDAPAVDPRADKQTGTGEDPGTGGPGDKDGDGIIDRIG